MTTGQRISEKRKELGLSQEALGEKLGVSRQSIYKWESDASLPDIDKLISLSRLFGVTVGWLLGVEEVSPPPPAFTDPKDWSAHQEQVIEDVLKRYHQTQPKVKKTSWEWAVRFLGFACVVLMVSIFTLNSQLDNLNRKYNSLNASLEEVKTDTSYELDNMSDELAQRLESVLKSQSELAVDYDCEVKSFDLAGETVTFSLSIVPKTYIEGMTVCFQANSNGEFVDTEARQVSSQTFAGELTCPLTDSIAVSAIFQTGDTRQMQLLNQYTELYTGSLPDYHINDTALNHKGEYQADGYFRFGEQYVYFGASDDLTQYKTDLGIVEIESVDVGLFLNRELVHWLEPSTRPNGFKGSSPNGHESWDEYFHDGFTFFYSPAADGLTLKEGDTLHFAARITDSSGRVTVCCSKTRYVMRNGQLLTLENQFKPEFFDPTQYQF